MPRIKNRLFQPLAITLEGEKTLYLRSREAAEVSRSDLNSRHLQASIRNADVAVIDEGEERKPGALLGPVVEPQQSEAQGEETHA